MKHFLAIAILSIFLSSAFAAETAADGKHKHGKKHACKEKMLEKFDLDKDGKLNEAERTAAKAARKARHQARIEKMKTEHPERFAKIDSDGDGTLSREEMKSAKKHRRCKKKSSEKGEGKNDERKQHKHRKQDGKSQRNKHRQNKSENSED